MRIYEYDAKGIIHLLETNGLIAYFAAIIGSIVSQVAAPEVPVVGAIIGGLAGGVFGYLASKFAGALDLERLIKNKLAWLFKELFDENVVY